MVPTKLPPLLKPTIDTAFQIDFDWWKKHDRDWRIYLKGFLCEEHQNLFSNFSGEEKIDYVDPITAKVSFVDAMQHTLISHCAKQELFNQSTSAIVDSVFRLFLANGNQPLKCIEIAEAINKPPELILRTFGTALVYKGIRPII